MTLQKLPPFVSLSLGNATITVGSEKVTILRFDTVVSVRDPFQVLYGNTTIQKFLNNAEPFTLRCDFMYDYGFYSDFDPISKIYLLITGDGVPDVMIPATIKHDIYRMSIVSVVIRRTEMNLILESDYKIVLVSTAAGGSLTFGGGTLVVSPLIPTGAITSYR